MVDLGFFPLTPLVEGYGGFNVRPMQGRARPSLAKLYNWRYKDLGDLPNVLTGPQFLRANAGFAYDYQFIDVGDYQGQGESCPVPYFYQVRTGVHPTP